MNKQGNEAARFDDWLVDESDVAALVMRQWLEPVEGKDAVIFPPTYPLEQNKAGYNIDPLNDGSNVCQIDSVGSQANRMEPIFKRKKYKHLVPQVTIKAGTRTVHLLDAGHRAADAIVRFSTLGGDLFSAFDAYRKNGDAEPLAKIAPTSIVFGAWDSRATQVKLPRIVRSVIRAYDVDELTRSAQYTTIAGEILEEGEAEVTTRGLKAELGLAHVPAARTHGGVRVRGEIRRDAILNLAALRAVAAPYRERTMRLRRYLLGLSLVAITAPQEPNLREGCELVADPQRGTQWTVVKHDGTRENYTIAHEEALAFATAAAESFRVGEDRTGEFKEKIAKEILTMKGEDAKKLLRQGAITEEALERIRKKTKKGSE
ncbi:type I-G CRISPR-associated RAMP protein Csb1/Cas7g [Deferrisoma sp.]